MIALTPGPFILIISQIFYFLFAHLFLSCTLVLSEDDRSRTASGVLWAWSSAKTINWDQTNKTKCSTLFASWWVNVMKEAYQWWALSLCARRFKTFLAVGSECSGSSIHIQSLHESIYLWNCLTVWISERRQWEWEHFCETLRDLRQ